MHVYRGNAGAMADKLLQVDIEEERQLDELIQTCTWHIYQMCADQTIWRYPLSFQICLALVLKLMFARMRWLVLQLK